MEAPIRTIDESLVTRSQAGDEIATTELVTQLRPVVQRYARRFFDDPSRAEDLAQTALMKAFSRVGDLRAPEAIHTWVLRITRNECLNELARHRVPAVPLSTLEDQGDCLEAPPGGSHDPEEMLARAQMVALVRRAAASLPEHYRLTLTMRALEDRSYEEVSEALDVPVTVARLWYCRARKRFRRAFIELMTCRRGVPLLCQEMGLSIADMIEGTLPRADRDRVQGHLVDCAACRQTEDELRNTAFQTPTRLVVFGLLAWRATRQGARQVVNVAGRAPQMAGRLAVAGSGGLAVAAGTVAVPASVPAPPLAPLPVLAATQLRAPDAALGPARVPSRAEAGTEPAVAATPAAPPQDLVLVTASVLGSTGTVPGALADLTATPLTPLPRAAVRIAVTAGRLTAGTTGTAVGLVTTLAAVAVRDVSATR